MIGFREWLSCKRRNKMSATGQMQSGMRMRYSVKPPKPPGLALARRKLV
jgi:hypothetical protein